MDANNASDDTQPVLVAMDIDPSVDLNHIPAQTIVVAVSSDSSSAVSQFTQMPVITEHLPGESVGVRQIIYKIEPGPSNTVSVTEQHTAAGVLSESVSGVVVSSAGSVPQGVLGTQGVQMETSANVTDASVESKPVSSVANASLDVQDTALKTASGGCSGTKGVDTSAASDSGRTAENQMSAEIAPSVPPVSNIVKAKGGQHKPQKRQNPSASADEDTTLAGTARGADANTPDGQHIVINNTSWYCQQCNETQMFASGKTLDAHLRQKHRIHIPTESKSRMTAAWKADISKTKNSDQPDQKTESLKQQYVQTCDGVSHVNSENTLISPAAGTDGTSLDTHDCQVCNQAFPNAEALEIHLGRCSKLRRPPVQCKACKQKLHTQDQLNIHIFADHLTDQSAVCLSCGTNFDNYRKLTNHMILMPGMHPDSIGHTAATLLSDSLVCLECDKQIAEYKRQLRSLCKSNKGQHKGMGKTPVKPNVSNTNGTNTAEVVEQPRKDTPLVPVQKSVRSKASQAGAQTSPQRTFSLLQKTPVQPSQLKIQQSPQKTEVQQSPQRTIIYQAPHTTYVIQTEPGGRKCLFCDVMLTSDRDQLQHMLQMHSSNFASPQDAELAAGILLDETNVAFTIEMDPGVHDSEPASADSESWPPGSISMDVPQDKPTALQPPTQATQTSDATTTILTQETGCVCDICGEVLKNKSMMQRHRKSHYPSQDRRSLPFKCDQCKGRYADKESLEKHKIKHQYTSRACKYCKRKFLTLEGVRNHEKHHHENTEESTGHFPFECDQCTAKFRKEYSLRDHKTTAHGSSDRHECHVCGASYSHINTLRQHMRFKHENMVYKCETCGESFKAKKWLVKHKAVHTGKDPLTCPICSRTFMTIYSLDHHMQRHTGNRPFICDQCDRTYVLNSHLKRHKLVCKGRRPGTEKESESEPADAAATE